MDFTPTARTCLLLLSKEKKMIRSEIVERTGISRSTIFDNLLKLEKKGFVIRYRKHNGKVGRPKKVWEITNEGERIAELIRGKAL